MSADWYKEQLVNRNYLTPVGFKLKLERFAAVDFLCQAVNLPDVTMQATQVPTRFREYPIIAGGGVTYGDLQLRFIVDEDMVNYSSIWNWIRDNGNAETDGDVEGNGYSAGQLQISTSNHNANFFIDFERLFPVSLTELAFDATVNDIDFFTANVTFKYTRYTLRDKNFRIL